MMLNGTLRNALVILLLGLGFAAATAISVSRSDYRVGLDSLLAIWGDFVRDADKIGLVVTRLSAEEETKIGDQIVADYYGHDLEANTPLASYVSSVGSHIIEQGGLHRRDITYKFHVLEMDYANAWAIPGGHVFITTGLISMMSSEAQLASILSHEIAHVDLRHVVERLQYEVTLRRIVGDLSEVVQLAYSLVNIAYSVQQESEADRAGLLMMSRAGYSPLESLEMFYAMEIASRGEIEGSARAAGPVTEVVTTVTEMLRDYFATHPTTGDRIVALMQLVSENMAAWQDQSFCVGRTNLRDLTSCIGDQRPGEWQELDLTSPEYHLRLAVLAQAAGRNVISDRELSLVLAAAPDYPATVRARARAQVESPLAALADLRASILLLSAQVRLGAAGEDRGRIQSQLGQDFALHAALAAMLGRRDYVAMEPSLADFYAVPIAVLCRSVLAANGVSWRGDTPLNPLIQEAQRRGYTPLVCRVALGAVPHQTVSADRPKSSLLKKGDP